MSIKATKAVIAAIGGKARPRSPRAKPKGPPVPLERDIQKAIIAYLTLIGAAVVRVNSGLLPTPAGRRVRFNRASRGNCSDVLACWRGLFIAVEVKRPGGKPTAGQSEFLADVERNGGVAVVATCVGDVERAVIKARYGTFQPTE